MTVRRLTYRDAGQMFCSPPVNESLSLRSHGAHEMSDTGTYWKAAGVLVDCEFCGAQPFESCSPVDIPLPSGQMLQRSATYQGSFHMQRTYEGHRILRQMLEAGGAKRVADRDCPPEPPLTLEFVVEIVESAVARALAAAQPPRKATPRPRRKTAA